MASDDLFLHVGSGYFTPGMARLHTFRLGVDGSVTPVQVVDVDPYPTFLALGADGRTVYVNVESDQTGGAAAIAFRRHRNGALERLSTVRSGEQQSAHITTVGPYVAQSNYESHSVTLLSTKPDGDLESVADVVHEPDGAFTHSAVRHPEDDRLFVANRTAGTVVTYRIDDDSGTVEPAAPPYDAGARGPRHLVVSADGSRLYCSDEQASTVSVYRVGDDRPVLVDSYRTVPAGWSGENRPADVTLHPSGRSLYVTNRQHRSVAVFDVRPDDGELELVGTVPTGDGPRNLSVDPSGRMLAVGSLRDDTVSCIGLDPATGRPTQYRHDLAVTAPSGILLTAASTD